MIIPLGSGTMGGRVDGGGGAADEAGSCQFQWYSIFFLMATSPLQSIADVRAIDRLAYKGRPRDGPDISHWALSPPPLSLSPSLCPPTHVLRERNLLLTHTHHDLLPLC